MLQKIIYLIQFLFFYSFLFAQQPAYFMLGEDQFRGVQIYDVIQDDLENYWFSTNNGLYFYNGVKFEQIQCPESQSISFFNLVVDSKGTVSFPKN